VNKIQDVQICKENHKNDQTSGYITDKFVSKNTGQSINQQHSSLHRKWGKKINKKNNQLIEPSATLQCAHHYYYTNSKDGWLVGCTDR